MPYTSGTPRRTARHPGARPRILDRKALDMLHTRHNYGALTVVLETSTGRVVAVLHRLSDPARNASELFSARTIDAAVQSALIAWESTQDH